MSEFVFAINEESCIECGQCRRYCPIAGAIIIDERYQHHVLADVCTGCGLCEAFCPVPHTLYRIARKLSEEFPVEVAHHDERKVLDYLIVLRRVVWRGRWRYHDHPIMRPITAEARTRLRDIRRSSRQRRGPLKVVGVLGQG